MHPDHSRKDRPYISSRVSVAVRDSMLEHCLMAGWPPKFKVADGGDPECGKAADDERTP